MIALNKAPRDTVFIFRICDNTTESALAQKRSKGASSSTAEARPDFLQAFLKLRKMRSSPVNLAAAGATPELLVIDFCERLELFNYLGFGDFAQRFIAPKAPRKWGNRLEEVKASNYLDGLLIGILGTRAISVLHNRMHEQAPVTC